MISFLEQQFIDFENILSYKTRVEKNKLCDLLRFVEQNIDALGLQLTGKMMFTISEIAISKSGYILGVEILVPVNKPFDNCERYIYKPRFRLVNAVSIKFSGSELITATEALMQHLTDKKLAAISQVYYMFISENNILDNAIFNAYISVSENMV